MKTIKLFILFLMIFSLKTNAQQNKNFVIDNELVIDFYDDADVKKDSSMISLKSQEAALFCSFFNSKFPDKAFEDVMRKKADFIKKNNIKDAKYKFFSTYGAFGIYLTGKIGNYEEEILNTYCLINSTFNDESCTINFVYKPENQEDIINFINSIAWHQTLDKSKKFKFNNYEFLTPNKSKASLKDKDKIILICPKHEISQTFQVQEKEMDNQELCEKLGIKLFEGIDLPPQEYKKNLLEGYTMEGDLKNSQNTKCLIYVTNKGNNQISMVYTFGNRYKKYVYQMLQNSNF